MSNSEIETRNRIGIDTIDRDTPFVGESVMAQNMRRFDWRDSPLGPVSEWTFALRSAVTLCLGTRLASCIYWGAEHIIIYNDAYASILGNKHPGALGEPTAIVWPEILDVIGPLLHETYFDGVTTGADDAPIFINRSGYVEEFYCSFSYTPIVNETQGVEGVFATIPETSMRVIGERRLQTLQKIGASTRHARSPTETLKFVADVIAKNAADIPFATFYLLDQGTDSAQLCARANIDRDMAFAAQTIRIEDTDHKLGYFHTEAAPQVARVGVNRFNITRIEIDEKIRPLPHGTWQIEPIEFLAIPLLPAGIDAPKGIVIAALNPHKRLDDDYLGFFTMLSDQITRALTESHVHQQEYFRIRELQAKAQFVQHEERVRIARDLHDTLLQSVQGMRFLIEAGLEKSRVDERTAFELFEKAFSASDQAIAEGRQLLALLRNSEDGAVKHSEQLSTLAQELIEATHHVRLIDDEKPVIANVWQEAYAICREVLTNAARHARCSLVDIQVAHKQGLHIKIADNGIGMSEQLITEGKRGHYGLQGMRERARNIDAQFTISSEIDQGTTVDLRIPAHRIFKTNVN